MLRTAERRPARDDLPPRRILATVPAHTKPECIGAFLAEFDSFINLTPTRETISISVGAGFTSP
ncbi:hypothetical protein SAMN05444166_1742 [Singulisphaera sp. GP187]|nr:hypothetical protein SAMN05444166_1742 [Singulisphaera sp. GP187]